MKNITQSMVKVLRSLQKTDDVVCFLSGLSIDESNALHECLWLKYVIGLFEFQDGNGYYTFSSFKNVFVSEDGLAFLSDNSLRKRILKSLPFQILKGMTGYLLGILSAIIVNLTSYLLTGSEVLTNLIQWLLKLFP